MDLTNQIRIPSKKHGNFKTHKMKKASLVLGAVAMAAMLLVSSRGAFLSENAEVAVGENTEAIVENGDTLNEVTVGKQVWMAQNLDVDKFRNGDPIPEAKTKEEWKIAGETKQPVWCYYYNDSDNGVIYGKLYNWYAVNDPKGLAPSGWHLPTDAEWTILKETLGDDAGIQLKSTSGWEDESNGNNKSGFSGLPGGLRTNGGDFYNSGKHTGWWSSTELTTTNNAWYFHMSSGYDGLGRGNITKRAGYSVRCIRD